MKYIYILIISSIFPVFGISQIDFDISIDVSIKQVKSCSPSLPFTSGWVRMKSDDGAFISNSNNTTIVFDHFGNDILPTTYISGNSARFEGLLTIDCEDVTASQLEGMFIQAINPNGFNLPIQEGEVIDNQTIMYNDELVVNEFMNSQVRFFKEFELNWFVSFDQSLPLNEWNFAGTSKFPLYVLHDNPELGNTNNHTEPTQALNSLIHLSCESADGQTTDFGIQNTVWQNFTSPGLVIRPVDLHGNNMGILKYGVQTTCTGTSGLLTGLEGRCEAFANLFDDMLRVQGVDNATCNKIQWKDGGELPSSPYSSLLQTASNTFFQGANVNIMFQTSPSEAVFLVEAWDIDDVINGFVLNPAYNDESDGSVSIPNAANDIEYRELFGVSGIGNGDPLSVFVDHMVVKLNGDIYDPSYGNKFASHTEWENGNSSSSGSLSAFGSPVAGNSGNIFFNAIWIIEDNSSTLQTIID